MIFDRVQYSRSCQQMLLRHRLLPGPRRRATVTSVHVGGRGAVKVVAGEPTLSTYHIAPTPLTAAQDRNDLQ